MGYWVEVFGLGFGVRGKNVKSRDCVLPSDLVRAMVISILALNTPTW